MVDLTPNQVIAALTVLVGLFGIGAGERLADKGNEVGIFIAANGAVLLLLAAALFMTPSA